MVYYRSGLEIVKIYCNYFNIIIVLDMQGPFRHRFQFFERILSKLPLVYEILDDFDLQKLRSSY